jgi:cytochrome c-type biogenesis protein CcmH/NrfG
VTGLSTPPPGGGGAGAPAETPAPAERPRARFDPDELAALESERDFLLRSISDLEAERAAGNLEPDRYERLRDDYTARAAAVLRAIEEGVDARPSPPPVSLRRKLVVGAGLVGFAVAAALLLAGALGQRLPGQTVTGNAQTVASDRRAALERQVRERPDDPAAHLALARFLRDSGQPAEAVKEFDATARLDPKNAEAQAYSGWVVYLAARSDPKVAGELTAAALRRLDAAVAADPNYPDAHFFRGMVLFRGKDDAAGAVPEFERFLALVPPGSPVAEQVKNVLDQAKKRASGG